MEPNRKEKKTPDDGEEFLGLYRHLQTQWARLQNGVSLPDPGSGQGGTRTRKVRWKDKVVPLTQGDKLCGTGKSTRTKSQAGIIHHPWESRDHTEGDCGLGRRKITSLFLKFNI